MLRHSVSFRYAVLLVASLPVSPLTVSAAIRYEAASGAGCKLGSTRTPLRAEQWPKTLLLGLEDFLSFILDVNVANVFEFFSELINFLVRAPRGRN